MERLKVNTAGRVERIVLICEDISQLVADKLRSANLFVNIPMGVTVNPVFHIDVARPSRLYGTVRKDCAARAAANDNE